MNKSILKIFFLTLLPFVLLFSACNNKIVANQIVNKKEIAKLPVYIVSHDWHAGIVIDTSLLDTGIQSLKNEFPDAKYIEIGWGDEEYYQADKKTFAMRIKALFYPTDSVLHIAQFSIEPEKYFSQSNVQKVLLTKSGFKKMLNFINDTVQLDNKNKPIRIGQGLYGNGFFYKANGSFHMNNTCNTWIAKALAAGGIKINENIVTSDALSEAIKKYKESKQSN